VRDSSGEILCVAITTLVTRMQSVENVFHAQTSVIWVTIEAQKASSAAWRITTTHLYVAAESGGARLRVTEHRHHFIGFFLSRRVTNPFIGMCIAVKTIVM
jgi:hypothetical protein